MSKARFAILGIGVALCVGACGGSSRCESGAACGVGEDAGDVVPETGEPDAQEPELVPADLGQPDYGDVYVPPEDKAQMEAYLKELDGSKDMTTEELFAKYYQARPYLEKPSYDPLSATYMDLVDKAFALTAGEKEKLAATGFVVTPRFHYPSHAYGYLDVFVNDVPVLITTDSILFAVHKSYDLMLKKVEEGALIPLLDAMLSAAHAKVADVDTAGSELAAAAAADVDLFYAVARSLLAGTPVPALFADNEAKRDELLALVEALQPQQIELFGRPYPCPGLCAYDFSQFKPRGHYTETEELKRYFKAMIWLGRTEMALTRFPRDLAAAYLLHETTAAAGKLDGWSAFDRAIQVFVGKSDNLTMEGLTKFLADQGVTGLADLADEAKAEALMAALEKGGYADQKIMSQIMEVDPLSDTPEALPPIFAYFGQRFVIDSYVFSNVVFDRIIYKGEKMWRLMPSPLDAMFVLGYQEALPLLQGELDQYHYAQNLNMLRYIVGTYDAAFWAESMYNVWLDAIRALAADTSGEEFPDPMRTLAYERKAMHTGLASWAELRHDTILYVKQSYTGEACDYPDGYVEPYADFYGRIGAFAATSKALFAELDLGMDQYFKADVDEYFSALEKAAGTLEAIAEKELKQEPRTPEETAFIKSTVVEDSMCGMPPFSGWYTDLFFGITDETWSFDPTIADVHTDPNAGQVLHVGTGEANLLVLTANTSCGVKAYAGPTSSYYEVIMSGFVRLTDEEWQTQFGDGKDPEPPLWTADFLVK